MWKKNSRWNKYLVAVLIILEIFSVGTPAAYAQISGVSSLITSGAGAALGAALSCNKDAIQSGLGSLFSGRSNNTDKVTDQGCNGVCSNPNINSAPMSDGKLDYTPGTGKSISGLDNNTTSSTYQNPNYTYNGSSNTKSGTTSNTTGVAASAVPVTNPQFPYLNKTATSTAALVKKQNCTNAIEKAAAQTILKQLTLSTVNWINHGFQGGGPLFMSDPTSYLKSMRDKKLKDFASTYGFDSKNYPFGKMVVQSITSQLSTTFARQAQYSLDKVIAQRNPGKSTEDFMRDFAVGGWAAFNAQFNIANNPVGFDLAAKSNIASQIQDTVYSPAQDIKDMMMRGSGFLDTKKCVDPADYDPNASSHTLSLDTAQRAQEEAQRKVDFDQGILNDASQALNLNPTDPSLAMKVSDLNTQITVDQKALDNANKDAANAANKVGASVCKKWITQTPGSVIASSLNTALATPFMSLNMGADLNADLTAVFDALTNQLVQKGLASLSSTVNSSGNNGDSTKYTNNQGYAPNVAVDGNAGNDTNFLSAGDAFQTNIFDLDPSGTDSKDPLPQNVRKSSVNPVLPYSLANGQTVGDQPPSAPHRTNLVGIINREQQLIATEDKTADTIALNLGWTSAQKKVWTDSMQARDSNYTNLLGKQVNLAKRLIPAIYQLDFCVPGPHPNWQADSEKALDNFLKDPTRFPQSASASDLQKLLGKSAGITGSVVGIAAGVVASSLIVGTSIGSIAPGIGTAIGAAIGLIVGTILAAIASDTNHSTEGVYRGVVGFYLGIKIDDTINREWENGYTPSASIFTTLESRYEDAMSVNYTTQKMIDAGISPAVIASDETEWATLPTYINAVNSNNKAAQDEQDIISQLIFLGKRINDLQTNKNNLDGFPNPAPVTYEDYQAQLSAIAAIPGTKRLTDYQRELKRVNDMFNLIAPDLHSESDITEQEAALDNISAKLDTIAGTDSNSELNQCIADVTAADAVPGALNSDGAPIEPLGRVPLPDYLSAYIPESLIKKLPTSVSFLPDFYYGSSNDGGAVGSPSSGKGWSGVGWTKDYNKMIVSTDKVRINEQRYPYSLSGLEYVISVY